MSRESAEPPSLNRIGSQQRPLQSVLVLAQDGGVAANSRVHVVLSDGTSRNLGITGRDGRVVVELPREESPVEFLAIHEDGVGWTRRVELSEVLVRLAPSGQLRGIVQDLAGSPVEGLIVLAVPRSLRELVSALTPGEALTDPRLHVTRTGPDGRFLLRVPEAQDYSLVAGGNGLVQVDSPPVIRAGEGEARILIKPLYAARVTFTDEAGASVESPRITGGAHGVRMHPIDPRFRFLAGGSLSAGLSLLDTLDSREGFELDCFLVADYPDPQGAKVEVTGSLPGFEPFRCLVGVPPAGEGCPRITIKLMPRGEVGRVRVQLEPCPPERAAALMHGSGILHLTGAVESLQAGVLFGAECTGWTADVPSGDYTASFEIDPQGVFESPQVGLTVGKSVSHLLVNVANTGGLRIVCTAAGSDGALGSYDRGLRLFIGAGSLSQDGGSRRLAGSSIGFKTGPFLIPVIQPGSYTALVENPRLTERGPRNFVISEGGTTLLDLSVDD